MLMQMVDPNSILNVQSTIRDAKINMKLVTEYKFEEILNNFCEQITSLTHLKVTLNLKAIFSSEESASIFTTTFTPTASNIRYFSCTFNSSFRKSDDYKSVFTCISGLVNAYRISLMIQFKSDDTDAEALEEILPTLNNLHILTFQFDLPWCQGVSPYQIETINKGINAIPNLELVEWISFKRTTQLASPIFASYSNYASDLKSEDFFSQFKRITSEQSHLLTDIIIKAATLDNFILGIQTHFCRLFDYCFSIPYLTKFKFHLWMKICDQQTQDMRMLLDQFLFEKMQAIKFFIAFEDSISPHLTINPLLAVIDLLY